MPITKSAKKALRQNIRRNVRNAKHKELMRKILKEFKDFVSAKKTKEAREFLPQVYKILDKAAKWGIIKKNNASRNKSRLTALLNKFNPRISTSE